MHRLKIIIGARSSAGEHYGDIVGVAGSNPAAPTTQNYLNVFSNSKSLQLILLFFII